MKNIAGYQFVSLSDLQTLKTELLARCEQLGIKGTILLSHEGINFNLCGKDASIDSFLSALKSDDRLANIPLKVSHSESIPFKRMKVKIKKEIITMRQNNIDAVAKKAPSISPAELKQWLDEQRDFTLLDTRNTYEVSVGTFDQAEHCNIEDFCDFPKAAEQIDKERPVVMFCTGGIRCEKAALYMLQNGSKEVYQLDGGILNYFAEEGGAHNHGDCFVFDERTALNPELEPKNK